MGSMGTMGYFEAWDRHNQRTLEWHNHIANEQRKGRPIFKSASRGTLVAVVIAITVGRRVFANWIDAWVWLPMIILMMVGFYLLVKEMRTKRIEWEATRRK